MTKLAIIGFTGYSGRHIAAEALRRGHAVIGLSRHRPSDDLGNIEIRTGSIEDRVLVRRLFEDADVVVIAVHASADGKPFLIHLIQELLSYAVWSGKRMGVIGGSGSLLLDDVGPRLLDTQEFSFRNRTDSMEMSEVLDALRSSDTEADWFFVSPSYRYGAHAPGVALGSYRLGGDVLLRSASGVSEISGPDFARAVIDEIESPAHHKTRFTVGR